MTKFVVNALPFHVTTVAFVNPAPLTVSVNAGLPAIALWGEMFEIESAVVIVNVSAFGAGVVFSETDAVPGDAINAEATVAVS